METYQCSLGIFISQKKHAFNILKKFKMNVCKPMATPLTQNKKVSKDDGERLYDATQFRSLVGSLLYLTTIKPNLIFATSYLSRFMSSPSHVHFGIIKRVLRYLKGTIDYGTWYEAIEGLNLIGYLKGTI